ncbi:MAG: V-type ATP synthase subunit A [bacterium]
MGDSGRVIHINGPLVTAVLPGAPNGEQVRLGDLHLSGEVIAREADRAVIQVYEPTESLRPGEKVVPLGHPLSVELGPGLLGNIFDGVQRPLARISEIHGDHIPRGLDMPSLDRDKSWKYSPVQGLSVGDQLKGGQVLGTVQETDTIQHQIMVPPDVAGELVESVQAGSYTVTHIVAVVRDDSGRHHQLTMVQRWPVRHPRPFEKRDHADKPLITGQRILDTFFPLLKGGKAAIPGPFGAGKTMLQQQIARWANADIVIYVGCGERGNELVDILESFPELTDPHTGRSLMERTLLVANTSNMPVVAREASIYIGVTIAEYYRDQGLDVVLVADSTSRWAEALREVSGRLGEMPVEEGYPAYLASRLSAFYERAGRVKTLNGMFGSITLIGAVSPPGGDFSEPVTSHTKEIVRCFWGLSKELADARHYPSISWTESFSGYVDAAAPWWAEQINTKWQRRRADVLSRLAQADELSRIVNLVGPEALSAEQRWILESGRLAREGLLQQNATDETDSYASPEKQYALLTLIDHIHTGGARLIDLGVPVQVLLEMSILSKARRAKGQYRSDQIEELNALIKQARAEFEALRRDYEYQANGTDEEKSAEESDA